jgi:hypothetical protein
MIDRTSERLVKKYVTLGFLIIAVAIPFTIFQTRQNQDNRSSAASADKLETEDGILSSSGTNIQSDSSASGGKFIVFSSNMGCSQTPLNTSTAGSDGGFAWYVEGNFGTTPDNSSNSTQSKLRLFENSTEIGPAHSIHAEIRNIGQGKFSHWSSPDGSGESIRFSAKDNSDPRTNGKNYTYCIGTGGTSQSPTKSPTSPATSGAIFYVSPSGSDSNPGTQASPWRTMTKAADTLKAGETAIVMDGTYTEGSFDFRNNGTKSSPITIKAQNKWGAILASTSSNTCSPSISVDKSWVTIDGIRITVAPGAINGCSSPSSANGAARCWATNPYPHPDNPTTGTEGCTFRNLKVDPSNLKHVGIKTNQDNSLIENSEIHNSIEPFGNANTIIRYNKVFGTDVWGSSIFGKGGVRNMQVYGNIVKNGAGILLGGDGWTAPAPGTYDFDNPAIAYNSVAYNNVVINDSPNTGKGIGMAGAENSAIYNNVIIGGGVYLWSGYSNRDLKSENPKVVNNIVVCNGAGATSGGAGWEWSGTAVIDYNLFYNCPSGVPTQAHPRTGNPNFVNSASDWHLQPGSPAIGTGIPVTMPGYGGGNIDVNKNFDGVNRTTPWNLGIY